MSIVWCGTLYTPCTPTFPSKNEPKRHNRQCLYVLLWRTIPKAICQGQAGDIKSDSVILRRFILDSFSISNISNMHIRRLKFISSLILSPAFVQNNKTAAGQTKTCWTTVTEEMARHGVHIVLLVWYIYNLRLGNPDDEPHSTNVGGIGLYSQEKYYSSRFETIEYFPS